MLFIFNGLELCFRPLKKFVYYKIYETKEELVKELLIIINKEDLKKSFIKNFREILEEYLMFTNNHKYIILLILYD